jgi:hypothetical protein
MWSMHPSDVHTRSTRDHVERGALGRCGPGYLHEPVGRVGELAARTFSASPPAIRCSTDREPTCGRPASASSVGKSGSSARSRSVTAPSAVGCQRRAATSAAPVVGLRRQPGTQRYRQGGSGVQRRQHPWLPGPLARTAAAAMAERCSCTYKPLWPSAAPGIVSTSSALPASRTPARTTTAGETGTAAGGRVSRGVQTPTRRRPSCSNRPSTSRGRSSGYRFARCSGQGPDVLGRWTGQDRPGRPPSHGCGTGFGDRLDDLDERGLDLDAGATLHPFGREARRRREQPPRGGG